MPAKSQPVIKQCERCGKDYPIKPSHADGSRFCSKACYKGERKPREPRVCPTCGRSFTPDKPSRKNKFCGKDCVRGDKTLEAPAGHKWCKKGEHYQPIEMFARSKRERDGRMITCKLCRGAKSIAPEAERDARAAYLDAHPDQKWCAHGKHFASRSEFVKSSRRPDGLDSVCRVHKRERGAEQYHRDKPQIHTRRRLLRAENITEVRQRERERRERNRESINRSMRAHYYRNREWYKEKGDRWRRENPEKFLAKAHRRRAREKEAAGGYTGEQLLAKFDYHGWRCLYCGKDLTEGMNWTTRRPHKGAQQEHRKPLDRGGSNWIANIAPSCLRCNYSKRTKTEAEFREYMKQAQIK